MPDAFTFEFGAREEANRIRDEFEDFMTPDQDRRTKTVSVAEDAPMPAVEQMVGRATETKAERETGLPGVELTKSEKRNIDFSDVNPLEARHAKAKALEAGVSDFTSYFDPTLTVEEHEQVFERASREGESVRDTSRSIDERFSQAYTSYEGGIVEHAKEGVKHGSQQAAQELRQRGWGESQIQSLKSQPAGALHPQTEVLFPDVGTTTPQQWATAKRSHEHRRVNAQNADEGKSAQTLTTDVEEWRDNSNKFDFPGVDTPRSTSSWLDEDMTPEFGELTHDLWTW